MATAAEDSTRSTQSLTVPRRVFAEEFLAYLAQRDEPLTAEEAEMAGPRHLEPDPQGGWAVLREGESLAAGDVPEATFLHEEVAMIAAAVLPGLGRRLRFRLGEDACERGFPVLFDGMVVGHSRHFQDALAVAMTVVDAHGDRQRRARAGREGYGRPARPDLRSTYHSSLPTGGPLSTSCTW